MRETAYLAALSLVPQVDYDTRVTPGTTPKNYEQIIKDNYSFADFVTNAFDNAGFSTGTPYPTETGIETHDVTQTLNERMSSEKLGRRAYGAFGDYTPEALTGDSEGAFKHTFLPLNPHDSDALPVYTYGEKAGEHALSVDDGETRDFPSMFFERFSLAGDGTGFILGESALRGSGKIVKPSELIFDGASQNVIIEDEFAAALPNHFFRNTAALLSLYPQANLGGTVLDLECRYRGFRFVLNNNPDLEKGYLGCAKFQTDGDPDSGAVRGDMRVGAQTMEAEFVFLMDPATAQTFNPTGKQIVQTVFSSKLVLLGGPIPDTDQAHKATLSFNRQTVQAVQIDSINGDFAYRVTPNLQSQGLVMPMSLEIINDVPDYSDLLA